MARLTLVIGTSPRRKVLMVHAWMDVLGMDLNRSRMRFVWEAADRVAVASSSPVSLVVL